MFYICSPCITRNNIEKIYDEIVIRNEHYFFYQPKCLYFLFKMLKSYIVYG